MNNNFYDNYRYDSCVSRGRCSVNPRTSSLQEILVLYLKNTAYYALKLHDFGVSDEEAKNIILNTISIMVSNPEFSEEDYKLCVSEFNRVLSLIIKRYETLCKNFNRKAEHLKSDIKYDKKPDIIKSIQAGEKEYIKRAKNISSRIRDLYKIMFVLAKSLCINILYLESFNKNSEDGYFTILSLLNSLNLKEQDTDILKSELIKSSEADNKTAVSLRDAQTERYGKQREIEVSYTTVPNKAMLVVGSNIRELEDILEAVKETQIDIYTHDEMMLAHTFPAFSRYKNLKGQYGQGTENCLLDFATFPGPIILTRHSVYNVENLYRGLLYTTDNSSPKGVIKIENKDFSGVIKQALDARGFKTGKQCETVTIGYDYENCIETVRQNLESGKFSRVFVLGAGGYALEQQTYFEKLLKQTPDDILIVSLYYNGERDNLIHINACFDSYAIVKFSEGIKKLTGIPIHVFFPDCDRHTISQMIYLSQRGFEIRMGKCTPIMLNPNLIETFKQIFGINSLTSAKKDLEEILN